MKYQPHQPWQNDNVSHDQPLKTLFTLLSGVLVAVVVGYLLLGVTVDFVVDHLPEDGEALIVSQFGSSELVNDQVQDERAVTLQAMFTGLLQCAGVDYPLSLILAEPDQINAFAMPGGQIGMFTGLVNQLESENGLAFVLATKSVIFRTETICELWVAAWC